jgi:hypothetical protein
MVKTSEQRFGAKLDFGDGLTAGSCGLARRLTEGLDRRHGKERKHHHGERPRGADSVLGSTDKLTKWCRDEQWLRAQQCTPREHGVAWLEGRWAGDVGGFECQTRGEGLEAPPRRGSNKSEGL